MEPPQSRRGKKRPRSSENTLPIVSVTKKNERPNLRPQKIIVLGAGVAGLACSRELKQRGYEVLVVEARSRIGGRLKGELLDLGADYPSTLPDSAVKKKPGRPKRTEPSSAVPQTTLTRQHPVDVGGALIHGIQNNPIHQITTQMGVPIHPVSSDCLLMDAHGWPFDPKVDEKVSNFFNECLDVTFTLAEKDRSSLESFGKLFEKVCREKSGGTNTNWETPLLKWHRANLELPSGASFYDLGHTWNEDEPYGFDGVHAAVEPSWRLVMENLSEGLDIVKNAPVREVRIVLPDGTTPLTLGDSNTRITTAKLSPTTVESNDAAHLRTNANSSDNEKQKKDYGIMNTNDVDPMLPTQSEEMIHEELDKENGEKGKSKRRVKASLKTKTTKKSKKAFDPTVAERRFSRRQRNIDVNVRCSSRSTKGRIQRLEYDHDWDESQRRKKRLKTKSGKPIGNANTKTLDNVSTDDVKDGKMKEVREEKPVVYDQSSVVQVALRDGSVLEADALVCTLPLGILKLPQKDPCHVRFVPSLHPTKQKAIKSLGCGLLNKCAISFPTAFWQDSDFLGQAESEHSYLVLNAMKYTQKPILIFMYGGDFAKVVESWTDRDIVEDCLRVLRKICGGTGRQKDIPAPVDYCITRWGKEEFSRMAFTYIPPGIDGHQALKAVGQPVFDPSVPTKPLIMFAGEHTTPYHPSTMHGAFLSGIREAYRFDLSMEPILNKYMKFDDRIHVYKHTFVMKRVYQKTKIRRKKRGDAKAEPKAVTGAVLSSDSTNNATTSEEKPSSRRRGFSGMTLRSRANATSGTTTTNSERKIIDDVAPSTLTTFELENPTSNGTSAKLTKSASLTISRHGGQRSLRGRRKSIDSRTKSSKRISYSVRDPTPKELSKSEMRAKIVEQEDRSLFRAFESYGKESYSSLLQSHILPVYGSIRKRNARQVLEHWERLQHESPSNQSGEAIASHKPISSWLAKDVVYDSWDIHCARIAADVSTEPDGVGSSSITRRSRRGIKRKSF